MTLSYTPRFHLAVPDFLSEPWHAEFAAAMESIDQALFTAIVAQNTEVWFNSTIYVIGDIVIDPLTGTLYSAAVGHTSSSTGTFHDELALHPDYWTSFAVTAASQSEAEAGTDNAKYMTPLRVAQAITAQSPTPGIATTTQAQEGTNNTEIMTPLRVKEGITARIASQPQAVAATDNTVLMTPLRVAQQIAATGISGGDAVGFSAHKNGVNQTGIASGVATKVTFGTELYDLGNFYDTSNSRWTPPSGQVHIDGSIAITAGVTNATFAALGLYKNGVLLRQSTIVTGQGGGADGILISIDDFASGTDFYELFTTLTSSTTSTVSGTAASSWFTGTFLGEVGTVTLGLAQVGFRAHKNGVSQNIPNSSYTKVTFGFEDYDQGNRFDTTLSRWTPPVGLVHLDAGVFYTSGATGAYSQAAIYKNGVLLRQAVVALPGASSGSQVSVDDSANGTDYYELFVFVSSGSVASLDGATANTWFGGHALVGIQGAVGPQGPQGADGAITAPVSSSGRLRWVSATQLSFTPYNGDRIKINGAFQAIPAAGIAGLSNTNVYVSGVSGQNLAANTTYYVYAFMNSGIITADFSITGHASSTTAGNVGVEIKIGDDTRTLIGLIRTGGTGGVQFVDSINSRFVLSWFNRRERGMRGLTTSYYWFSGDGNWREIITNTSASCRVNFLTWGDECVPLNISGAGYTYDTGDASTYAAISIDSPPNLGGISGTGVLSSYSVATNHLQWWSTHNASDVVELSEGFHFAAPMGLGNYTSYFQLTLSGTING
jgi:hypothetical protein